MTKPGSRQGNLKTSLVHGNPEGYDAMKSWTDQPCTDSPMSMGGGVNPNTPGSFVLSTFETTTRSCKTCGKLLKKNKARSWPMFCNRRCSGASRKTGTNQSCETCGNKFYAIPSAERRYCSPICADKGKSVERRITRTCPHCGIEFSFKRSRYQIFCSIKCRVNESAKKALRTCQRCNKEFSPKYPSMKNVFCSSKCSANKMPALEKICWCCNKPFVVCYGDRNRIYCSLKCSNGRSNKTRKTSKNLPYGLTSSKIELSIKKDLETYGFVHQYWTGFCWIDYIHPVKKIALFVDGVFWHGIDGKYKNLKESSLKRKIKETLQRDRYVSGRLENEGWKVLRYTDRDVKTRRDEILSEIATLLTKDDGIVGPIGNNGTSGSGEIVSNS